MTLSSALRAAALDRAQRSGETVDGIVLEPSGVIDLRELARAASHERDQRVTLPWLNLGPATTEPLVLEPVVIDVAKPAKTDHHNDDAVVSTTNELGRAAMLCDRCGSFGRRDLIDQRSQTEYYSCATCHHLWPQAAND